MAKRKQLRSNNLRVCCVVTLSPSQVLSTEDQNIRNFRERLLEGFTSVGVLHHFAEPEDVWGQDKFFTRAEWKYAVANDDTTLGYWGWLYHQKNGTGGHQLKGKPNG
jgi:hypothetical protein